MVANRDMCVTIVLKLKWREWAGGGGKNTPLTAPIPAAFFSFFFKLSFCPTKFVQGQNNNGQTMAALYFSINAQYDYDNNAYVIIE